MTSTKCIGMDVDREGISITVWNAAGKLMMNGHTAHSNRDYGAGGLEQILLEARKLPAVEVVFSLDSPFMELIGT